MNRATQNLFLLGVVSLFGGLVTLSGNSLAIYFGNFLWLLGSILISAGLICTFLGKETE